jgi:hypothetical protein
MDSWGPELNVYAVPAILTLVLLVAETAFLMVFLPETRGKGARVHSEGKPRATTHANGTGKASNGGPPKPTRKQTTEKRIQLLKTLRQLHFLFLGIFSGVEFTLTFLTFDCGSFLFRL